MDYQLGPGPLQVDQNTTDEKIKGDIGIVENGDVATHAILKDYYVIWKGNLYKAKADISSGTTLSAETNGNLDPKSNGLGGEVAALNSKLSTTSPTVTRTANIKTNSVVHAKRNANVVSIYMDVYAASTLSDYVSIASLSEAPPTNVYFVMTDVNDNAKMCRLTSGGLLQIYGTVADKNYMGSLTYIVNS